MNMTKEEALRKIKELQEYIEDFPNVSVLDRIMSDMVLIEDLTTCPFYIGKYVVTEEVYGYVMNTPVAKRQRNLPKADISWNDINNSFLPKLNNLTGKKFRLPTEEEWLACASIDGTKYSGSNILEEVGWCKTNSKKLQPVGKLAPNTLGLYDMSGNVWEWCCNLYSVDKDYHVLRGGSWYFDPDRCRVAIRRRGLPGLRGNYLGFRLALSVDSI